MAFNPALHPRGPNGRFTRSYARHMNSLDGTKKDKVKASWKSKAFKGAEDARTYLRGLLGGGKSNKGTGSPTKGAGSPTSPLRGFVDSGALGRANESLRAGKTSPEVQVIDKEMKPLPDSLDLYRSVPAKKFGSVDPKSLEGMKVSDAGYFPTTIAPTKPVPGNVKMHIQAPAGTPAAVDPDSGQVVLGHGAELAVDSVDVSPDGSTEMSLVALPGTGQGDGDAPSADAPDAPDVPSGAPDAPASPSAPDTPPAPTATPAGAPVGGIGDVIDEGMPSILEGGPEADARRQRARQQLGDAMNGTYAGLTAEVTGASRFYGGPDGENPGVRATLVLRDADGNEVGRAERAVYRDDNGDLVAVHELLEIDDRNRGGGGLASAFNAHLTDWYREQGVSRIELTANIDVGGYAWASHGYDFADENSANGVMDRLRDTLGDADGPDADAARALLARAESAPFGSPDYPTPFEISQLGRPEGASGRDATWLGKQVMLGSSWEGTRWL